MIFADALLTGIINCSYERVIDPHPRQKSFLLSATIDINSPIGRMSDLYTYTMKLREWLLLLSLLCMTPMAMAHGVASPMDEVASQSAPTGDASCIECGDPFGDDTTGDCYETSCCSLCTTGLPSDGHTNTPAVTRIASVGLGAEAIAPPVFSPPFRPPIA